MRRMHLGLALIAAGLSTASCKEVECGDGTIERDGACVASDVTVGTATCGPLTELVGDVCVPMFTPTVCDPATTDEDVDPATNVTTCVGTGGGGCGAALACTQPETGKQTICGQLYDLETGEVFAATESAGTRCDPAAPTADGPCSVRIQAYDAIAFSMNPNDPNARLPTGDVYLDDCGRYRLTDVTLPASSPFIALGLDDVDEAAAGPLGTTNATGVATPKVADLATRDLEMFVAPRATTDQWAATGGPPINAGIYAMIFRARSGPSKLPQAGVTILRAGMPTAATDHYFVATDVTRARIDINAAQTGANGTGLLTAASLTEGFTGTGALPAECRWSVHAAATLPFVLFIQVLRPVDAPGMNCPL